ncbi:3-ketoacyl-CoA thiolase, partial [Streptomyces sp. SID10244]|nr:3-ketoacyl-CoA thiolase [Streptomyces sp. SID10244]
LRVQQCVSCDALIHPPKPICPECRSGKTQQRIVSGKGILFGYTVNERFALPGLKPPYVVAEVALDEDPRVRLTTRLIDCPPEDIRLGMPVEVLFEHHEDVWLPLFRRDPSDTEVRELPADPIAPADYPKHVRPMVSPDKFEDRAIISGVGASEIGRRLMRQPLALTIEACERA